MSVLMCTDHARTRSEGNTNTVFDAVTDDGMDLERVNAIAHVGTYAEVALTLSTATRRVWRLPLGTTTMAGISTLHVVSFHWQRDL